MLILQENCSDATGAYVVYAPVDYGAMKVVMSGGDPDYVALLPSGFAIFPDGPSGIQGSVEGITCGGCLLTISFQILVESQSNKLSLGSVATVNNLITCTVDKIKSALGV
jgi:homeobox-leucine zipper protein